MLRTLGSARRPFLPLHGPVALPVTVLLSKPVSTCMNQDTAAKEKERAYHWISPEVPFQAVPRL